MRAAALVLMVLVGMVVVAASGAVRTVSAQSGVIYGDVPPSIDPARRYFFYMHALIIEQQGRQALSREFGRYYYDDILKALADRGLIVISEVRGRDTVIGEYAQKIAGQVGRLMEGGVPPEGITVTGFSKGGTIAMVSSAILGHTRLNFVIMAGCGPSRPGYDRLLREQATRMRGRMLSVYDAADRDSGSCQEAFRLAPGLQAREIRLSTGLGHGLFYAPRKEWLDLVFDWAHQR